MRKSILYVYVFVLGTVGYGLLELMYRGRTHWTMLLFGGASMLLLYMLYEELQPVGRLVRCLTGCIAITVFECLIGSIVNCRMGMCIWDYSGLPFNVRGQICPAFSAMWFALCFPGDLFCARIARSLSCWQSNRGCRLRLLWRSYPDA